MEESQKGFSIGIFNSFADTNTEKTNNNRKFLYVMYN